MNPTRAARREVKDTFFQDLERILSSVPACMREIGDT